MEAGAGPQERLVVSNDWKNGHGYFQSLENNLRAAFFFRVALTKKRVTTTFGIRRTGQVCRDERMLPAQTCPAVSWAHRFGAAMCLGQGCRDQNPGKDMKTVKNRPAPRNADTGEAHQVSSPTGHPWLRAGSVLLNVACVVLGLGSGVILTRSMGGMASAPKTTQVPQGVNRCRPGPWGNLEYMRIFIEPPDNFILDVPPWEASWFFKGYTRTQVEEVFRTAGLTEAQLQAIMTADWTESAEGITVVPGRDLVLGLSREARGKIYNLLGEFPENPPQYITHRYKADSPDEWFHDSGLRPETQELVTRLLYKRGNFWAFSDFVLVASGLSEDERIRLCKTLSRRSTLLLNLRIDRNSDIAGLTRYWGRGGRAKDVGALLSSVARRPNGGVIDIVHLLPRTARTLLYTYPRSTPADEELNRDCHWTSLNFFRWDQRDEFATDETIIRNAFAENYRQTDGEPLLGDVVGLVNSQTSMVHSCVYVAEDIVFTKNGNGWDTPWTLALLEDVLSLYNATTRENLSVVVFRAVDQAELSL